MIRRALLVILLLLTASAVLGWLRAGTIAGERPPAVDGWQAMQYAPPTKADYAKMSAQIKSSSLLPLSLIAERKQGAVESAAVTGPRDAPPFPKVLSNYERNKTKYVVLLGLEGKSLSVKAGDVLENGWEIKVITDTQVKASFDGQEFEAPLVAHLQSAFEKPEESAMDVSEDLSGTRKPTAPANEGGGE